MKELPEARASMWPVVPAYFHPAVAGRDWQNLTEAGSAVRAVILNAANGPGERTEPALRAAATRLSVPVLGYVDTAFGERPAALVARDVARHLAWYPVAGIFFDRVAAGVVQQPHYAAVAADARRRGATTVMFHHGCYPDQGYAALADILGVFEGPAIAHEGFRAPAWVRRLPPESFCHLVYDTPAELVDTVLSRAAAGHAATVYVTDRAGANPWDALPAYFADRLEPA